MIFGVSKLITQTCLPNGTWSFNALLSDDSYCQSMNELTFLINVCLIEGLNSKCNTSDLNQTAATSYPLNQRQFNIGDSILFICPPSFIIGLARPMIGANRQICFVRKDNDRNEAVWFGDTPQCSCMLSW